MMNKNLDVVIIVPTYNSSNYLSATLESLLTQKFIGDWMIYITDDASTDGTVRIIHEYQCKYPDRINVNLNEKNLGIAGNLFSAYRDVGAKYIFPFSGDDLIIDNNLIQYQFDYLERNPDTSMCFSNGYVFYEDNLTTIDPIKMRNDFENPFDFEYWARHKFFHINVQAMLFRKSSLPPFEDWMFHSQQEDWMFLVLILQKGKVYFFDNYASLYRMHSKNETSSGNRYKQIKGGIKLIRNLNKFTRGKYEKYFGSNGWRYERLVFACLEERKYFEFLFYLVKFIFSRYSLKGKINFIKTLLKILFRGYKVQF